MIERGHPFSLSSVYDYNRQIIFAFDFHYCLVTLEISVFLDVVSQML